jgi:hypothetical protein
VRDIDYVSVKNVDTAAATVSIIYDDNTTDYTIAKFVLAVGDQLTYTHGTGWQVIASDGTLKTGAGLTDGDKGDITVSGSGAAWTIDDDVVTYAKMQNVSATSRILGRKTAAAGDPEECTLSEVLDFIGSAAQGDILYRGASSWGRLAAGTSGNFLKTQGTGANPAWGAALTSGTQKTLSTGSPTYVDFTSIPPNVKMIVIMINGLSGSGTSNFIIQIGDSGGIETSGYAGSTGNINTGTSVSMSSGFTFAIAATATHTYNVMATLTLMDSSTNTWMYQSNTGFTSGAAAAVSCGSKALSATLDRVRLTTAGGTDTFDAGTMNISYVS